MKNFDIDTEGTELRQRLELIRPGSTNGVSLLKANATLDEKLEELESLKRVESAIASANAIQQRANAVIAKAAPLQISLEQATAAASKSPKAQQAFNLIGAVRREREALVQCAAGSLSHKSVSLRLANAEAALSRFLKTVN
jgi:hypothetical protein